MNVEEVSSVVVDTAFHLHRDLGPGDYSNRSMKLSLRLLNLPVGLLINFSAATFKEGIRRVVNKHQDFTSSRLRVRQNVGGTRRREG